MDDNEDPGGIITPAMVDERETFSFTICNPPFFESIKVHWVRQETGINEYRIASLSVTY
jgi:23S rRNA A1618 N6-methylase RlmF